MHPTDDGELMVEEVDLGVQRSETIMKDFVSIHKAPDSSEKFILLTK